MTPTVLYREDQHFNPWLLLLPTALLLSLLSLGLWETRDQLTWWQPIVMLGLAIAPSFVLFIKIVTEVRSDGVYVRLFPFPFRRIPFETIERAETVVYRPILEYGGWGLRFGRKATAYNARGNRGVMLHLRQSRNVLLGSQDPESLLNAILAAGPVTTR